MAAEVGRESDGEVVFNWSVEGEFEGPDRLTCRGTVGFAGFTVPTEEIVVIGNDAWINSEDGWRTTTVSDASVAELLDTCAGSPTFWEDFGLSDRETNKGQSEEINGVPAVRYDLGEALESLAALGFAPAEFDSITAERFVVWLAEEGKWPVAVSMRFLGDATALELSEFGLEEGQLLAMELTVQISDVNNPDIRVYPPLP